MKLLSVPYYSPYPITFHTQTKNGKKRKLCSFKDKENTRRASALARKELYQKSDFIENNNIVAMLRTYRESRLVLCFDIKNFFNSLAIDYTHPLYEAAGFHKVDLSRHLYSKCFSEKEPERRIFVPWAGLPASSYVALRLIGSFIERNSENMVQKISQIFDCSEKQIEIRNYSDNLFVFFKGGGAFECDREKLILAENIIEASLKESELGVLNKTKSYFIRRRKKGNRQEFMRLLGFRVLPNGGVSLARETERKLKKELVNLSSNLADKLTAFNFKKKGGSLRERWLVFLSQSAHPFEKSFLAQFSDEKEGLEKLYGRVKYYLTILLKVKVKPPGFLMRIFSEIVLMQVFFLGSLKPPSSTYRFVLSSEKKESTFLKRVYKAAKYPSLITVLKIQNRVQYLLVPDNSNPILLASYREKLLSSLNALYFQTLLNTEFFKPDNVESNRHQEILSVIRRSEQLISKIPTNPPPIEWLTLMSNRGFHRNKAKIAFLWKTFHYCNLVEDGYRFIEHVEKNNTFDCPSLSFLSVLFNHTHVNFKNLKYNENSKNISRNIFRAAEQTFPILAPLWGYIRKDCNYTKVSVVLLIRKIISFLQEEGKITLLLNLLPLMENHYGNRKKRVKLKSLMLKNVINRLDTDVPIFNYLLKNRDKHPRLIFFLYTLKFKKRKSFLQILQKIESSDVDWHSLSTDRGKISIKAYFYFRSLILKKYLFYSSPFSFHKRIEEMCRLVHFETDFKENAIPAPFRNIETGEVLEFKESFLVDEHTSISSEDKELVIKMLFDNSKGCKVSPCEKSLEYATRLLEFSPHVNRTQVLSTVKEMLSVYKWPVGLSLLFYKLACDRRGKKGNGHDRLFGEFLLFCRLVDTLPQRSHHLRLSKKKIDGLMSDLESCMDDVSDHPLTFISDDYFKRHLSPFFKDVEYTVIYFYQAQSYIEKCVQLCGPYKMLKKKESQPDSKMILQSRLTFCPVELLSRQEASIDCSSSRSSSWLATGVFAAMLFYRNQFPEDIVNIDTKIVQRSSLRTSLRTTLRGAVYFIVSPEPPHFSEEFIFKNENEEKVRFIIIDKLQLHELTSEEQLSQFSNSPLFALFDYVFISGRTLSNYREMNNLWQKYLKNRREIKRATLYRSEEENRWSSSLDLFESTQIEVGQTIPLYCLRCPDEISEKAVISNRVDKIEIFC